jgi:hypothetical protein
MSAKFFARHQFAGAVEEKREHSDRLALELELHAALAQLGGLAVELEGSKTELVYSLDWQMYPTIANATHLARFREEFPTELDARGGL